MSLAPRTSVRLLLVLLLFSGCATAGRLDGLQGSLESVRSETTDTRAQVLAQKEIVERLEADVRELRVQLEAQRELLERLEQERSELGDALEEARREAEERGSTHASDLGRAREAASELRAQIASAGEELESCRGRERQARRRMETLRVCCASAED